MSECKNCSPGYGSMDCPNGDCLGKRAAIVPNGVPPDIGLLCVEFNNNVAAFNRACVMGDNSAIKSCFCVLIVDVLQLMSFVSSLCTTPDASGMETR